MVTYRIMNGSSEEPSSRWERRLPGVDVEMWHLTCYVFFMTISQFAFVFYFKDNYLSSGSEE